MSLRTSSHGIPVGLGGAVRGYLGRSLRMMLPKPHCHSLAVLLCFFFKVFLRVLSAIKAFPPSVQIFLKRLDYIRV